MSNTSENNSDDGPEDLSPIRDWLLKTAPSFFRAYIGFLLGGLLASATIWVMLGWTINRYLDERDARLSDLKTMVENYQRIAEKDDGELNTSLSQIADSIQSVEESVSDIRERISRVEAQGEINTRVLTEVETPRRDIEYFPISNISPEPFMGGPDGEAKALGFEDMVAIISPPKTLSERSEAINKLIDRHRVMVSGRVLPKFDPDIHDFSVTATQVLYEDGSLKLQLKSTVIIIPRDE